MIDKIIEGLAAVRRELNDKADTVKKLREEIDCELERKRAELTAVELTARCADLLETLSLLDTRLEDLSPSKRAKVKPYKEAYEAMKAERAALKLENVARVLAILADGGDDHDFRDKPRRITKITEPEIGGGRDEQARRCELCGATPILVFADDVHGDGYKCRTPGCGNSSLMLALENWNELMRAQRKDIGGERLDPGKAVRDAQPGRACGDCVRFHDAPGLETWCDKEEKECVESKTAACEAYRAKDTQDARPAPCALCGKEPRKLVYGLGCPDDRCLNYRLDVSLEEWNYNARAQKAHKEKADKTKPLARCARCGGAFRWIGVRGDVCDECLAEHRKKEGER